MGAPIAHTIASGAAQAHEAVFRTLVVPALEEQLGVDVFSSWFGRLQLERIDGAVAHLSVPTKFLLSWIKQHYADRLRRALAIGFSQVEDFSLIVRSASRPAPAVMHPGPVDAAAPGSPHPPAGAAAHPPVLVPAKPEILIGSPLDRRLSFATFHLGASNQLAHAASDAVATACRAGVPSTFNPLFLHAAVGLGKTHLAHAIAQAAAPKRVIYLTAEKFMYGFALAIRAQSDRAYVERLRAIDLLVLDDAQFLQGKAVQADLAHAVDALLDAGKQIVVVADRPPHDLEGVDDRLRSRLGGGLVVEVAGLDPELRVKILDGRIAAVRATFPSFDVPPEVVAYVADTIRSNGRDLEGAVNRLYAASSLTQTAPTLESAAIAIRDLVRDREPKRVRIEDIQKLVAAHFNVCRSDILSSRRTAAVVRPRQIAMYLSKVLTLRSLPEDRPAVRRTRPHDRAACRAQDRKPGRRRSGDGARRQAASRHPRGRPVSGGELVRYDAACRAIAEAKAVDEVKGIVDQAVALRAYARQARNKQLEVDASEIRFRAERRIGELMGAQRDGVGLSRGAAEPKASVDAGCGETHVAKPTLDEAGIDKNLAHRARKYAAIPADEFESLLGARRDAIERENARITVDLVAAGDKAERRAAREAALASKTVALPTKRYCVILADPEWRFEPWSRETGMDRAADNHYPTSTLADICARDVASIAADDCMLAMWATVPMLAEAFVVLDAWGFGRFERDPATGFLSIDKRAGRYVSSATWTKYKPGAGIGHGYWFRVDHEILLVATRGSVPAPVPGSQARSVFDVPASQVHSQKPELVCEILEAYFPTLPKIELNRRGPPRPGWDAWGNEAEANQSEAQAA